MERNIRLKFYLWVVFLSDVSLEILVSFFQYLFGFNLKSMRNAFFHQFYVHKCAIGPFLLTGPAIRWWFCRAELWCLACDCDFPLWLWWLWLWLRTREMLSIVGSDELGRLQFVRAVRETFGPIADECFFIAPFGSAVDWRCWWWVLLFIFTVATVAAPFFDVSATEAAAAAEGGW